MELGILLALIALVGWGAGDVFARKAMFSAKAEVVLSTMIALTAVTLAATTVVIEGASALVGHDLAFFGLILIMAVLAWVTGNLFYFHGMQRAGVIIAAPILGAAPLIAIFIAVVFGGERPSAWTLVGSFTVVVGVLILLTDRKRILE